MKIAFHTLGCKVNQYETEGLKENFKKAGHEVVPDTEFADAYVINTCTVTNLADRKSRQFIRRARAINPDAAIAVTGCYVQVAPEEVAAIEGVDIIAGTNEKSAMVSLVEEYDVGEIHELDENISIRYTYSGHIFGAVQCELFIKIKNHCTKLLFTSDLGNTKIQDLKPFVQEFEPVKSANYVFGETTYGARNNKQITQKIINKDLEKIKSVIQQFCGDYKRRVLMPVFSLDKCPVVLWLIYQMFKDDKNFTTKVLVDSPLTNRLLDRYSEVLEGEAKEKFDEMLAWKNLKRIITPEDSKYAMENMKNILILSSGGMLQSGRSVRWAKELLPHSNDCLILSGYCGENTLGYKIKNFSDQKTISINGAQVKNKAQIVNVRSLSGHMQRDELLKYYSSIHTEKIYLLHGEMEGKVEFSQDLKREIANKSMTTNVCVVNKGTKISL